MSTQPFTMPVARPRPVGPEASDWFWNPNRVGVRGAPDYFAAQLQAFDPELAITWNPLTERWLVWVRKPKLVSKLCRGWLLLFPVRYEDGSYQPLDDRIFARLYAISGQRWGSGAAYFRRIEQEIERDRQQAEDSRRDSVGYLAREYFPHTQPWVGYGLSNGSKFANNN